MEEPVEDDQTISDTDNILRRVPNWPNMFKIDNDGRCRPTSVCFTDRKTSDRQLSFTIERDLLNAGGLHEDALAGQEGFGLASLAAGLVRNELNQKQSIVRDPQEEDAHHCLVVGDKSKADKRKMAMNCSMIIYPDNLAQNE